MNILRAEHLTFHYTKKREIFQDLSLCVDSGDILTILGANGAGKTTLLNCLVGLFKPSSGIIRLNDVPMDSMDRKEISRIIGYVPQIHSSNFSYSVLEYTVMGRAPYIPLYGVPSEADYEKAMSNLAKVGLAEKEQKIFTEISGGEQQLASIARALTQEAPLLFFDEPTNHLDYGNQYRILDVMRQLSAEGYTIISTTHQPEHALLLGGRAGILDRNGVFTEGPADRVLTSKSLSDLYQMPIEIVQIGKRTHCFISSDT